MTKCEKTELRRIELEEDFVVEIEVAINRLLREKNVNQAELARRLEISRSAVSQRLSAGGSRLTVRSLSEIFAALDEEVKLTSPCLEEIAQKNRGIAERLYATQLVGCEVWETKGGSAVNDISEIVDIMPAPNRFGVFQRQSMNDYPIAV